jgi:hypothetical protein
MKRILIAVFALTLVTGAAFAQHGPGGPGGPAGDHGPGDRGPEGGLIVGSDGTVFLIQPSSTSTSAAPSFTVKAIRSSGSTAWTATFNGPGHLELSGSNLLQVSSTTASDGTVSSTITAISAASGTVAWTRTLSGRVQELRPFSGGTYAVAVVPAATSGGTATRSLVAIGNDGSVLWTVSI